MRAAERLRRTWQVLMDGSPRNRPKRNPARSSTLGRSISCCVGELLLASGETTERVNEAMLSLAVAYELPAVKYRSR